MTEVETKINDIQEKLKEQQQLLRVLSLWEHAKKAGFLPAQVRAFKFMPRFASWKEKRIFGVELSHYNCVLLHDGTIHPISLVKRP